MDAPFPEKMVESIRRFLTNVHPTLPPGQDVYPEVFYSDLFYPLQRMRETEQMIQVARPLSPRTVMEIGADKGGGLYHWCKCLPTVENVIACEIRGLPYDTDFQVAFPDLDFLWLPQSSYDRPTVEQVRRWLAKDGLVIDVLFIDGDKGGFHLDFDAYLPLMHPHGVVFLHDVTDPPMSDVFARLRKRYRSNHIVDTSEVATAVGNTPYEGWLRHWQGRSCTVGVIYLGVSRG